MRLIAHGAEMSSDWQPFTIAAGILVLISAAASTAAIAVYFWLAGLLAVDVWEPARLLYEYCPEYLGELGEDPARCQDWIGENSLSAKILGWVGIGHCLVTALMALYALAAVLRTIVSPLRRRASWHETFYWEYVGRLETSVAADDRHDFVVFGGIDYIKGFLRQVGAKSRHGFGADRVVHAKRWAWAREAQFLTVSLAALLSATTSAALYLWRHEFIVASEAFSSIEALRTFATDFSWQLASSIPLLEPADVFNWQRPQGFADDKLWSIAIFTLKVLFFTPVVIYIVDIAKTRRNQDPPMTPFDDNATVQELLYSIFQSPFPLGEILVPWLWRQHYGSVAAALNQRGVTTANGRAWSAQLVSEQLFQALSERDRRQHQIYKGE